MCSEDNDQLRRGMGKVIAFFNISKWGSVINLPMKASIEGLELDCPDVLSLLGLNTFQYEEYCFPMVRLNF